MKQSVKQQYNAPLHARRDLNAWIIPKRPNSIANNRFHSDGVALGQRNVNAHNGRSQYPAETPKILLTAIFSAFFEVVGLDGLIEPTVYVIPANRSPIKKPAS